MLLFSCSVFSFVIVIVNVIDSCFVELSAADEGQAKDTQETQLSDSDRALRQAGSVLSAVDAIACFSARFARVL